MRYIAFLRAINVGNHVVKMDQLRKLFVEMGFTSVETFIASGNVIFESKRADPEALEARIERHLEKALGYEVGTFVRSCAEVAAVAAHDGYQVGKDCLVHIVFMKTPCEKAIMKKLLELRTKDDDFHAHKREVYWITRGSFRDSPAAIPLGKLVGGVGTMRNVNTVRRLAANYPEK